MARLSEQVCYDNGVQGGSVCHDAVTWTYDDPFIVTAKHLDYSSGNYYETSQFNGLIPASGSSDTYQFCTLVFCVKPHEYADADIFSDANAGFRVGMIDTDGGMYVRVKVSGGADTRVLSLPASGSPTDGGPLVKDQWNSVYIHLYHDNTSPETVRITVWVNGVQHHRGDFTSGSLTPPYEPMCKTSGGGWAGCGDDTTSPERPGLDCDIAFVWCAEENLDPDGDSPSYYYSFFSADHKPLYQGADGSVTLGAQPPTYFPNGDFTNNLGSGVNWTEVGTVADATSSPTD